jgi:hypothetical protein
MKGCFQKGPMMALPFSPALNSFPPSQIPLSPSDRSQNDTQNYIY